MNEKFISPFQIKKRFDISSNTLRTWAENDKIKYVRIRNGEGKRLYNVEDVERIFGVTEQNVNKSQVICYARVSSDHQKEDLNRQIQVLRENYPKETYPSVDYISDIGSGLNFKRKGFETLLERVYSGTVKTVVVTYKDRLCRFGFEIIEWILKKTNTELVVLNTLPADEKSASTELADDLLSITTVFVARNNGNRSAQYRRQRKAAKQKEEEDEEEEV